MKSTALVIFTLALAGTALGQIDRNRSCLTGLPVTIGFSIEAIEGVWYEVGRYNLKYDAECTVHKFEDRSNYEIGYTVSYNDLKGNIQTSFSDGLANSSKSLIILDIEDQPSIDLQFLHSDWKNFAIVYSCVQTGEATSTEQVWVLSAKPTLNVAKQVEVDEYIGTFLDLPAIEVTIQAPEHCQRALPERFLRRIANFFYK